MLSAGVLAWLDFNANTRVLSGTPDATGTLNLVYTVRDTDGDEATNAFRVTVAEPDTTPTAPDVPDQSAIQGVAFPLPSMRAAAATHRLTMLSAGVRHG